MPLLEYKNTALNHNHNFRDWYSGKDFNMVLESMFKFNQTTLNCEFLKIKYHCITCRLTCKNIKI